MRPPMCTICDLDFDLDEDNCGIIYFKKRKSDIEWDKKMQAGDMIGHPPYAKWFCKQHFLKAKELADCSVDEALPRIREFYKSH